MLDSAQFLRMNKVVNHSYIESCSRIPINDAFPCTGNNGRVVLTLVWLSRFNLWDLGVMCGILLVVKQL